MTVDITDRKQAETMQVLLAREVDHRARNALAIVQAIIRLARADSQEAYVAAVDGRVRALAHTHELLSKSRWQGADVRNLVEEEMAPYAESGRIAVSGPSAILPAEKAQTLGIALHELATNAAKYGALSCKDGRVAIDWTYDNSTLRFGWVESGGPPVVKPTRSGFGTKIINASLTEPKGSRATFDWDPAGVRCSIVMVCGDAKVAAAVAVEQKAPSAKSPDQDVRVLVVEDEALVGLFTCDCLEALGYSVVGPFASMADAENAVATAAFDFAVLDVNLAGRPIYPLADRLRAMDIPFVFVTGYARDTINPSYGQSPIVQKPISRDALAGAIKSALATELRATA